MSEQRLPTVRMIVNGKSAGNAQLRESVGTIRKRGIPVEVRVTWEDGDAARYAAEAERDRVETVIAAGGDGTINEVVSGLLSASDQPHTSLGIVPFGTANDFAAGRGIPLGDPLAAIDFALATEPTRIDVGVVNDRYFINVASGGFGAEVTAQTPREMKAVLGGAAYSLMGLVTAVKMTSWKTRLTIADRQEEGEMIVLAVGNGTQAGGGYQVTPFAKLNDGLLDLMVVHDIELPRFGLLLQELQDLRNPENNFVHYQQLGEFTIESDSELQLNLDGEPIRSTRFDFSILPQRIALRAPIGS